MVLTVAAQKPIHQTHAVVEDGAVDADGKTVLDIQPPRKSDKPKAEPATA
mgnify:CR=1 FL=1